MENTKIHENKNYLELVKKSRKSQINIIDAYNILSEDNKNQINILNNALKNKLNKTLLNVNTRELIHYILNAKKANNENYSDAWKKKMMFALKAFYTNLNKPVTLIEKNADKLFKEIAKKEIEQKRI